MRAQNTRDERLERIEVKLDKLSDRLTQHLGDDDRRLSSIDSRLSQIEARQHVNGSI